MTDRERLLDLVNQALLRMKSNFTFETLTDYLLANGVIVPPCKVGDTVYCLRSWPSGRKTIHKFEAPDWDWIMVHYNDFGKTVFLTREEAEKALNERGEGNV